MMNWTSVELVWDLSIVFRNGQTTASLFGNGRNCIAIIVSFLAMSSSGPIDLSQEDLTPHVYLTDSTTGQLLQWETTPVGMTKPGLHYSSMESRFCEPLPNYRPVSFSDSLGRDVDDKRGSLTYFLYGRSEVDTYRQIGTMIKLSSGKKIFGTKNNAHPHRLDLELKRPIQYTVADLEPIKWNQIWKKNDTFQQNTYVKMKREVGQGWRDYEFLRYTAWKGKLCYASRTTRKPYSYLFFYAPLGKQYKQTIEDRAYADSSHTLMYNQEPGALTIVYAKVNTTDKFDDVENYTDDVLIKLYDAYGNIGMFHLNYTNPIDPNFEVQNLNTESSLIHNLKLEADES